ncbi:MAG: hypothetical protein O2971_04690 [Proteobacteria bacterium]|nr:hypothetical protein [Pseudomonadota bacterium]
MTGSSNIASSSTAAIENQKLLHSLLESYSEYPPDDTDHHRFLTPLVLDKAKPSYQSIEGFVRFCMGGLGGKRGPKQLAELERHLLYMLLNLSRGMYVRQWTLVALDKHAYAKDYWLKRYGLSQTYMKDIVEALTAQGVIERLPGKKYSKQPLRTRIYPTKELQRTLWKCFLEAEQPIEPPYVTINEPHGGYGEVIAELDDDHPDLVGMTLINEFLKGHSWACKAPVRLTYKHDPFQSGRLTTPFQSLPDKKMRLRINTLIDGQPICEVDFSANHIRLNLAVFAGEDAGESPYEDIGELAGFDDRQRIKSFITIAMGASDREGALNASYRERISKKLFEKLEAATLKRYPKVRLFSGFGILAQNLEGQILRQVMLEGVDAGIVALPVHDAVAVVQCNEEWAEEAMLRAWHEHANSTGSVAKSRIKVDYPER